MLSDLSKSAFKMALEDPQRYIAKKQRMTISTTPFPIWLRADFPDMVDFVRSWGWGFGIRLAEVKTKKKSVEKNIL